MHPGTGPLTPARGWGARSYGPHDATRSRDYSAKGVIECDFKFAPFSGPVRRGYTQDAEEKENSLLLCETFSHAVRLELYPKSRIELFVTVLENDGAGTR